MIENAGKKIYISSHICIILYMILAYSMQSHIIPYSCISYKQSLSGDTKIKVGRGEGGWGGGGGAHNISAFMLIVSV
jgi:hypothetical protein